MAEDKQKIEVSFSHGSNVANMQVGNQNQMSLLNQEVAFSAPEAINIGLQISELREILDSLQPEPSVYEELKIVEQELSLPTPDKNKIGSILQGLLHYLGEKSLDVSVTQSLQTIFIAICSWLGSSWYSLMQSHIFHLPR